MDCSPVDMLMQYDSLIPHFHLDSSRSIYDILRLSATSPIDIDSTSQVSTVIHEFVHGSNSQESKT
jgi:hypothetical protein